MAVAGLCVLLLCLNFIKAEECVIDNRSKEVAWDYQLIKDLTCNYNDMYPPNTNDSFIEVQIRFNLKSFGFDSSEELFSILSWLSLRWKDDRLKWKTEDYGNLDELYTYNHYIWFPSLRIMNGDPELDYKYAHMVPCILSNDGYIRCLQKFYDTVVCSTKLWDWPYDSQKCKVEVGAWKYLTKKIKLVFDGRAANMFLTGYGAEWDITGFEQEENVDPDTQLRMIFTLERHGETLAAIIIYPGVVLAILTLTSFFLDVRSYLRLYFISFSLINHLQILCTIDELIPKHSPEQPSVLLYYRGSIVLSTLGVLLSVFLKYLCEKDTPPSASIERVSDYVVNSRFKYLILRWDLKEEKSNIWLDYVSLVNSLILYVFSVTYICMYVVFIPQPIPFN